MASDVICTEACRARVYCTVCGMVKAPRGRSVGPAAANSYCDWECSGYSAEPKPPHLFPGECLECSSRLIRGERGECDACKAKENSDGV